jgi:hypothetical protein
LPPTTKADRLLIAFVCGAIVFGASANLMPWVVSDPPNPAPARVIPTSIPLPRYPAPSGRTTGPAWRHLSELLDSFVNGWMDYRNAFQLVVLFAIACVVGLIAYGWRGHEQRPHCPPPAGL